MAKQYSIDTIRAIGASISDLLPTATESMTVNVSAGEQVINNKLVGGLTIFGHSEGKKIAYVFVDYVGDDAVELAKEFAAKSINIAFYNDVPVDFPIFYSLLPEDFDPENIQRLHQMVGDALLYCSAEDPIEALKRTGIDLTAALNDERLVMSVTNDIFDEQRGVPVLEKKVGPDGDLRDHNLSLQLGRITSGSFENKSFMPMLTVNCMLEIDKRRYTITSIDTDIPLVGFESVLAIGMVGAYIAATDPGARIGVKVKPGTMDYWALHPLFDTTKKGARGYQILSEAMSQMFGAKYEGIMSRVATLNSNALEPKLVEFIREQFVKHNVTVEITHDINKMMEVINSDRISERPRMRFSNSGGERYGEFAPAHSSTPNRSIGESELRMPRFAYCPQIPRFDDQAANYLIAAAKAALKEIHTNGDSNNYKTVIGTNPDGTLTLTIVKQ